MQEKLQLQLTKLLASLARLSANHSVDVYASQNFLLADSHTSVVLLLLSDCNQFDRDA